MRDTLSSHTALGCPVWPVAELPEVLDQMSRKKSGDLVFVWLWCAKVYSLFLLYIQLYFAPTPPLHPAPTTGGIPMSPVTVTVTIANQSSPAERRQPNKEEQKKGLLSVCFFLLNSNKYIEMQWFLLYPFLLSRRVKKFFISVSISFYLFIDLCWIFSSNPDQLSWWLAAQRGGAVWRSNTTGGGEEEENRQWGRMRRRRRSLRVPRRHHCPVTSSSLRLPPSLRIPSHPGGVDRGRTQTQRKGELNTDRRENPWVLNHTYVGVFSLWNQLLSSQCSSI